METGLSRLKRLALIDRLPGGRAQSRVDCAVIWRKRPMRALFELVERCRHDLQLLAEQDRQDWHLPAQWYITLCVARLIDARAVE